MKSLLNEHVLPKLLGLPSVPLNGLGGLMLRSEGINDCWPAMNDKLLGTAQDHQR